MEIPLVHSLVAPGTGPLHLAPRVTYSDQAFHVAAEINLQNTQRDGKSRTKHLYYYKVTH